MPSQRVLLAAFLLAIPVSSRAELTERQSLLLNNNCLQCHSRENTGAPLIGNPDDWKERNRQGEEGLLRHVIQGLRGMPPFGYCAACDEADLRALIRRMSGLDGGR
ncbi:c-type cytochrome [Telmatospirillum sp.]|uniref:c-type cytochrome n=1 Tax=Telmatospirillum sp. TaxID=2079197 RepID=UPI002842F892|nr:c-type cytochrome [Telmatospirillum sp.]MDR3438755.1 c-type cytochrome [Telmatospirillum sp.]